MFRRTDPLPPEDASDETEDGPAPDPPAGFQPFGPGGPDLSALPIAGITQRRMALLLGALIAAWIVLLFARQVSDASAASSRAEAMIAENATRHSEIAALERELDRIQQRRFIRQQARAHGLGGHNEIAFTLDPDAAPLPANAPGSAALRVGAPAAVSPLDSWLTILFGPGE
jgi:cell division protein FtsB